MGNIVLELDDVHTYYGQSHVLQGISLAVAEHEVVSLLGRNGAGKTTTIRTISGLTPPRAGRIRFRGREIAGTPPYAICRLGVKLVPQGRRIFPGLTVQENLLLALVGQPRVAKRSELGRIYERFPILQNRETQAAGSLSGGERQILAVARALLGRTALILLDEPSEGLAPLVVRSVMQTILEIRDKGVAVLLAEQNVKMALESCDRHYIIDKGRVRFSGRTDDILRSDEILHGYLGVSA